MLHYVLGDSDLSEIRFGISPLCEMGLSLRTIKEPSRYPLQVPWLSRTREVRAAMDLEPLLGLVNDRLWTPDFLNPRPSSPLTQVEDEFDALESLPSGEFTAHLERIHGRLPRVYDGPPRQAMQRMMVALRDYWELCFEPYWPRMRTILEADITHRGRIAAQGGLAEMLNGLSSSLAFDGSSLNLRLASVSTETRIPVDGRGIMLMPTMFTRRASAPVDLTEAPMVLYPARGQGALWETEEVVNPRALAELLGKMRASLLTALATPASSTELGVRFGVSASAINQHLRALRAAGLLTSTRYGHSVLYFRSPLGSALAGAQQVIKGR